MSADKSHTNPNQHFIREKVYDRLHFDNSKNMLYSEWHSWICLGSLEPKRFWPEDKDEITDKLLIAKWDNGKGWLDILFELNKMQYYSIQARISKFEKLVGKIDFKPGAAQNEFMNEGWLSEAEFIEYQSKDPKLLIAITQNELHKIQEDLVAWFLKNGFDPITIIEEKIILELSDENLDLLLKIENSRDFIQQIAEYRGLHLLELLLEGKKNVIRNSNQTEFQSELTKQLQDQLQKEKKMLPFIDGNKEEQSTNELNPSLNKMEKCTDRLPSNAPEPEYNIFRRKENVFAIRYRENEMAYFPAMKGLNHILLLLRSPKISIAVDNFIPQSDKETNYTEAEQQGLTIHKSAEIQKVIDSKGEKKIRDDIRRICDVEIPALRQNKVQSEKEGNMIDAKDCDEEIIVKLKEVEKLRKILNSNYFTPQDTNSKRKQNAIRNAIEDSLKQLEKNENTKEFVRHFRNSYSGGTTFKYLPEEEIEWVTD